MSQPPGLTTVPTGPPSGKTILLADDYDDTRDLYTICLAGAGYNVLTAECGREAVESAERWLPNVILMDIRMPDISGVEAMQILRQQPRFKSTRIVAFTANAKERARAEYLDAGFDAVIVKPCLPDELVARVDALCGGAARTAPSVPRC